MVGLLAALTFISPARASAQAASDVHFAPDGSFVATNIVVQQKAGSNLFSRATWGEAFLRMVVLISASTTITKNHGEAATLEDIAEQHLLDIDGTLATGANSIVINAAHIRDTSLERESKTLSGLVKSLDAVGQSFVLSNKTFGTTRVEASDALIMKGQRPIPFGEIAVGDKVTSVSGTYDYAGSTLRASSISVYQDKSVFAPRNFQGTLKSISATQLPTVLVVTVASSTDYAVYLNEKGRILNKEKSATSLSRFVAGDTVRFFGVVRQTKLTEADAEVVRDLNF
jgi:hypothetical protein